MHQHSPLLPHIAHILRWLNNNYYHYPYSWYHQDSQHSFKYTYRYHDTDSSQYKQYYTAALPFSRDLTRSGTP